MNADIWTMRSPDDRAEAMLVLGGRVAAQGSEGTILSKARTAGVKAADARGQTLLPGLIDSHTHLVHQGLLRHRLDLRAVTSLASALRAVRRRAARQPKGKLLLAERWDESQWPERRYPHRDELDAISTTVPIVMRRVDGHVAVGNRVACDLIQQRLPGVDRATGLLVEEASLNLNHIFPTPLSEATNALDYAQGQALRLGVTTVHDFAVPAYVRAYQALHRTGKLRIRAHVSLYIEYLEAVAATGFASGLGDDQLRFHGIKIFADGSLGGHTAALREPYADAAQNSGRLNFPKHALEDRLRTADAAGLAASVHAIGDAAIDQAAAALAKARRGKLRARIEHFELHTSETVAEVAAQGIVASMQPNFVGEWNRPGGLYEQRLGPKRYRRLNEFRRLRAEGVRLAFGSDCMPFDPWFGLAGCVNAPHSAQRLPMNEAIEAYTRGSAWGIGREKDLGCLAPGAYADFIVLPSSPTKASVGSTRPSATYVRGDLAFERNAKPSLRPR